MDNINNIYELSDLAIVRGIGKEIKRLRLEKNITQDQLSHDAGIDRSFLSQVENGRPSSMLTIIQIHRALKNLELFDTFFQQPTISPIMVAKMEKNKRVRARNKKSSSKKQNPSW